MTCAIQEIDRRRRHFVDLNNNRWHKPRAYKLSAAIAKTSQAGALLPSMSLPMLSQLLPSIFGSFPTILCSLRYSPQTGLCEVSLAICEEYLRSLQAQN